MLFENSCANRFNLQVPTLAAAASPDDMSVILVPDVYMLIAVLSKYSYNHLVPKALRAMAISKSRVATSTTLVLPPLHHL